MTTPYGAGRLLLAATPLGQPGDASARLIEALGGADVIAAEDTRRVRAWLRRWMCGPLGAWSSFFDQNEAARVASGGSISPRGRRCWWSATPACH